MNQVLVKGFSHDLYHSLRNQKTIRPLTERGFDITIDDAYSISLGFLNLRIELNGEKVVGKKIGVTSKAVQEMLAVSQPDFGFLTDEMRYSNGAEVPIAGNLIQPRIEAEIAFRIKKDILGPGVTQIDMLDAIDYVTPCFEIVDSRIHNWQVKIQDTIADNASCGAFILGEERILAHGLDMPNLSVVVTKNGDFLSKGLGSAVQGNPVAAAVWLVNTLGEYGVSFKAGEVILTGSLVPLEPVKKGDSFEMVTAGLGSVSAYFV